METYGEDTLFIMRFVFNKNSSYGLLYIFGNHLNQLNISYGLELDICNHLFLDRL
jgi:hypothetical protein